MTTNKSLHLTINSCERRRFKKNTRNENNSRRRNAQLKK